MHHVAFDVTDGEAAEAGVAAVEAELGPLDILVNNAGVQHRAPMFEFPEAEWHRIIETNLTSAFLVGRAAARGMVERGRGKIVNVASLQSQIARPGTAPYAASKGGLKMLTRGMCADWGPAGVQVNAIGPGYIDTELTSALVADPEFDAMLRRRTPAARWGQAGGARRRAAVPRLARLGLRERADPLRRRRPVRRHLGRGILAAMPRALRPSGNLGEELELAAILDCVALPVWVVDHDGRVLFLNPAGLAALGYDELDELRGRPGHDTIHYLRRDGSPFPAEECPMTRVRGMGVTVREDDDWFIRRDGSMFPVSYTSTPIDLPGGQGAVVAFEDMPRR